MMIGEQSMVLHAGADSARPTVVVFAQFGLILASAFPAILVYATELLPGKVGTISGLFFGLAFGMAGIASALHKFDKIRGTFGSQFRRYGWNRIHDGHGKNLPKLPQAAAAGRAARPLPGMSAQIGLSD